MVFRAAVLHGFHEGIDNHFSLAVPGEPGRFLLNPYGPHWSELTGQRPARGRRGRQRDRRRRGRGQRLLHPLPPPPGAPDAACVLHTHMPYATALALTETGFETRLSQNSVRFHGRYELMPEYGGLVQRRGGR